MTDFFSTGWPWVGLILAAILLALLFFTGVFRSDLSVSRVHDLVWLAWLATPVYMVHQFEEHGIDVPGAPYAFRGSRCGVLGYLDAATCPIPFSFLTAVNLSAVWIGMPLCALLLGRRRPAVALAALALVFTNAFAHIGPAILRGRYNPVPPRRCCCFSRSHCGRSGSRPRKFASCG